MRWEASQPLILDPQTPNWHFLSSVLNPKCLKEKWRNVVTGCLPLVLWFDGAGSRKRARGMLRSVWVDKCENNQRPGELTSNPTISHRTITILTNPWWRQSICSPPDPSNFDKWVFDDLHWKGGQVQIEWKHWRHIFEVLKAANSQRIKYTPPFISYHKLWTAHGALKIYFPWITKHWF